MEEEVQTMPAFVKTPKDERLWQKAKGLAKEQDHEEDWAYITGIFKKMKGGKVAAGPLQVGSCKVSAKSVIARYLAAADTAVYKGKKYKLLWGPGPTKFGRKCKLGFFDGSKEFWVDASAVTIEKERSSSRSWNGPSRGYWQCPICDEENEMDKSRCWECGAPRPRSRRAYEEVGREPGRDWEHGHVTPEPADVGEGSDVPPPRDRDGNVLPEPELPPLDIPGYGTMERLKMASMADREPPVRVALCDGTYLGTLQGYRVRIATPVYEFENSWGVRGGRCEVPIAVEVVNGMATVRVDPPKVASEQGDFEKALDAYRQQVEKALIAFGLRGFTVSFDYGPRWIRVVKTDSAGQKSVHTFIDGKNGDIYHTSSWKGPAGRARGNIFNL